MYLLISCGESTPPQNRQLIVDYYQLKYQVDGFVGVTSSNLLIDALCQMKVLQCCGRPAVFAFRAKREQVQRFERLLSESQGHNLALTVLCVPSSLDKGGGRANCG